MLGDLGPSFLTGYGDVYPLRVHNRAAACPKDPCTPCTTAPYAYDDYVWPNPPNQNVHFGALVGGPDRLADTYADTVGNYQQNQAALDSNAGQAPSWSQ